MAESGVRAEQLAADYLESHGYSILARNFKTYYYEIDIVAQSSHAVHIVEVKYRRSREFGDPLEYITNAKATRLRRAARAWTVDQDWQGDVQVDVIGISGPLDDPQIRLVANALGA